MSDSAFHALEKIYADLDGAVARLAPACRASGRCCRFRESGHILYTTPLEFEYLRDGAGFEGADRYLIDKGACPFLRDGRCGAREHRMLGCRIYYCDAAFRSHMAGLYEEFHGRVKRAMREHGIAYEYFDFLGRIRADLARDERMGRSADAPQSGVSDPPILQSGNPEWGCRGARGDR